MRKLWIAIVLILSLFVLPGVQAKGMIQKVMITGPGIDGQFSTTRADIVHDLSVGRFEDYQQEVEAPADPGEGFTLSRYYYAASNYHLINRMFYYPGALDGRDVVHVDGRWYPVKPEGTAAFQRLLAHAETQPYILLARGDVFEIADPVTLAALGTVQIPTHDEYTHLSNIQVDAAGKVISYEASDGTAAAVYQIDLETMSMCSTAQPAQNAHLPAQQTFASPDGGWTANLHRYDDRAAVYVAAMDGMMIRNYSVENPQGWSANFRGRWDEIGQFYLTDGERLLLIEQGQNIQERSLESVVDTPVDSAWLEIAGARDGYLYLYHPLGRYWRYDYGAHDRGEIGEGIYVIHARSVYSTAHWQPEMAFAQVILGDEYAYGLQAPRDAETVDLHALDMSDGTVTASRPLEPGQWTLAYVRLHPDVLSGSVTESECDYTSRVLTCFVHADASRQCYWKHVAEELPLLTTWEVIIPPTATPAGDE